MKTPTLSKEVKYLDKLAKALSENRKLNRMHIAAATPKDQLMVNVAMGMVRDASALLYNVNKN